ncbi:MAG: hypothetical protein IT531_15835 [Burkholderiales bacterium]|nr:hypothetical protein [Burkholderiales bacterium]
MSAASLLGLLAACLAGALAQAAQAPVLPAPAPAPPAAGAPGAAQPPQSLPAPQLGRLFFTPAERAALDDMRRRPQAPAVATAAKPAEKPAPPAAPAPEYVTLNGVVRRSDGATTVWLNRKPVRGAQSEQGIVVAPAARTASPADVTVRVPQTGRVVDLKVGQQLEVNSGRIQEGYRAPPPPAPAAAPRSSAADDAASRPPRRASRERELLRDLLREIDPPAAERAAAPAGAEPAAQSGAQ